MSKQRVYISSTFTDLQEYRAVLTKTFESTLAGRFELTRIMEYMGEENGRNQTDVEVCLEEVTNCNLYLLILGNKKGSSPYKQGGETYTEKEYKTAFRNKKIIYRFGHSEVDYIRDEYFRLFFDKGDGSSFHKNEYSDLTSFKDIFQRTMLRFIAEEVPASRLWYYLISAAIVLLATLGSVVAYRYTEDILVTLLVPALFLCILLFIWKDVLRPSNPFISK